MAKPIAKLTGTFLVPAVSANKRRYTRENIGKAVDRLSKRLESGGLPVTMNASHNATFSGDVRATGAVVTKVWQEPDSGKAKYEAAVLDTSTGRDIKALAVPAEDGTVGLKGVSIFGRWHGPVRDEDGIESADDLEVTGIDFTHYPGVRGAGIESAQLVEMATQGVFGESIDEFAQFSDVTTESDAAQPAENVPVAPDGLPVRETAEAAKDPRKPYGDVEYADPGYQDDKKKRYPLDTKAHVRAAWSYINMPKNQKPYTSAQVSRIKAKIKRAATKLGIDVQAEMEALVSDLLDLFESHTAVAEAYASMSLWNGQGSIGVSGSTDEPADLPSLAKRVAIAAIAGLAALDPDEDGDIDLDPDEDDTECEGCGAVLPAGAMYCPACGAQVESGVSAPGPEEESSMEFTKEQAAAVLTTEQAAKLDPSKSTYTAEDIKAAMAVETAPAVPAEAAQALVSLLFPGVKLEGAPAPVEDELTKARRLVAEAEAAELAKKPLAEQLAEILEDRDKKLIEQIQQMGTVGFRQSPFRKGLVPAGSVGNSGATEDKPVTAKDLREMDADAFRSRLVAATLSTAR